MEKSPLLDPTSLCASAVSPNTVEGKISSRSGFTHDGTYYVLTEATQQDGANDRDIVLFVHGIGSFHRCFEMLTPYLVDSGYKVLCYDLIGRGQSAFHATSKFGAEQHVDQLLNLLEHLRIERQVHIVGHSMGGAVATLFSSQYPEKVCSLSLLCPAGLMDGIKILLGRICCCTHRMVRGLMDNREAQEKAWRSDFFNSDGEYKALQNHMVEVMLENYTHNKDAFEALWQSIMQFPLFGLQRDVKLLAQAAHLKVFVLWGDRDQTVPIHSNMPRWRRILNSADCKCAEVRFKVMKNAGHSFFFEYPRESAAELLNFLSDCRATTSCR